MRTAIFLVPLAALSLAAPAQADWQYTRWGMSPEQVAGASAGSVSLDSGTANDEIPGEKVGARGTYSSGPYNFKVVFYFSERKLVDVRLRLISDNILDDAWKLKNDLDGIYGRPFAESGGIGPIITYHDPGKNNRVDLIIITNKFANLEYRPLRNASASGL